MTGNPNLGTKILGISIGTGFAELLNAVTIGNPYFLGTHLLGLSIERGFAELLNVFYNWKPVF